MTVGVVMDYPGLSEAQYEAVCRGLNHGNLLRSLADWPVPDAVGSDHALVEAMTMQQ